MSEFLRVYEVGPRDGLQNESAQVSTAQKMQLIDGLVDAGLTHIEAASFVHPRAVPQMADADELTRQLLTKYEQEAVIFTSLVLNDKGYERAYEAGSRHMALGVAVSSTSATHVCPQRRLSPSCNGSRGAPKRMASGSAPI